MDRLSEKQIIEQTEPELGIILLEDALKACGRVAYNALMIGLIAAAAAYGILKTERPSVTKKQGKNDIVYPRKDADPTAASASAHR